MIFDTPRIEIASNLPFPFWYACPDPHVGCKLEVVVHDSMPIPEFQLLGSHQNFKFRGVKSKKSPIYRPKQKWNCKPNGPGHPTRPSLFNPKFWFLYWYYIDNFPLKFSERAGRAGADAGHADRGCDDVPAAPRHDGRRPRLRLQSQLCRPRGREEHVLGRHPQAVPQTRLHVRRQELPRVQGEDGHGQRWHGRAHAQGHGHRVIVGQGGEREHITEWPWLSETRLCWLWLCFPLSAPFCLGTSIWTEIAEQVGNTVELQEESQQNVVSDHHACKTQNGWHPWQKKVQCDASAQLQDLVAHSLKVPAVKLSLPLGIRAAAVSSQQVVELPFYRTAKKLETKHFDLADRSRCTIKIHSMKGLIISWAQQMCITLAFHLINQ